ncbi:MAG: hypothetical protein WBH47_19210 [Streptosporangiaceae bacterium]
MREHVHVAARRRDERLALIRKITLWTTGVAAAASLGLGAAFAHAIPGHAASTASTPRPTATPSVSASPASASSAPASSSSANPSSSASKSAQLAQPRQLPTHTAAPHAVTSGGS